MTTIHNRHYGARALGDRGSVSVLAAVLIPCLLLILAVVADGSARLRAIARADAIAAEAARAATTAIDTRGPGLTVDPDGAQAAARAYLAAAGHTGHIRLHGTTSVEVTTDHTEPAMIGLIEPDCHVHGRATAWLATGTTTPARGTP